MRVPQSHSSAFRQNFSEPFILERLRLPLQVSEARCESGAFLDREGRHRAACARSGRLKTRALAPLRALARVCREAGATVWCNARLRDMNLAVTGHDDIAIKVLASGLPLFFGAQLAVNMTLRCGTAQPGAARIDGAVCSRAREEKERKYSELLRGDRYRLVVVALETGSSQGSRCSTRHVPLGCTGVAQTVVSGALSVLRPLFCKFVGGFAHCVACPWRSRWVCP